MFKGICVNQHKCKVVQNLIEENERLKHDLNMQIKARETAVELLRDEMDMKRVLNEPHGTE